MDSTGIDQSNGRLLKHDYEPSASRNVNHLSILQGAGLGRGKRI